MERKHKYSYRIKDCSTIVNRYRITERKADYVEIYIKITDIRAIKIIKRFFANIKIKFSEKGAESDFIKYAIIGINTFIDKISINYKPFDDYDVIGQLRNTKYNRGTLSQIKRILRDNLTYGLIYRTIEKHKIKKDERKKIQEEKLEERFNDYREFIKEWHKPKMFILTYAGKDEREILEQNQKFIIKNLTEKMNDDIEKQIMSRDNYMFEAPKNNELFLSYKWR